jgi:hypothetical protein
MANTVIGASVQVEFGSVGELRKTLQDATQKAKDLKKQFGETSDEFKNAQQDVDKLKTTLQGLNLKSQLKDANLELTTMQERFGATSEQAINAARKIADLKDRIDDARQASDVFDPGKKFQVIADVGSKIAAGFSAVQGAMALVGSESEDLQKALLKVQGAMALAQGLSELKDFGEAWNKVKLFVNNATQGMSAFKKAMIGTGIGLFVVAIGTLIAYWDDLKDAITGANSVTKAYAESQKEVSKAVSDAKTKFNEVATAISLAKDGVISKDQALETYNEKLGDTFGKTTSLEIAETRMAKYTNTYLKAIELRTRAQVFYGKAAEAAAKAAAGEDVEPGFWETVGNGILSAGNATVFASKQAQTYGKNVADLNDQQKKFTAEADKLTKDAIIAESELSDLIKDNNKKRTADNKKTNDERINAEKEITQFLENEYEKRNNIGKEQFEIDIQNTSKLYDEKIALAKKYNIETEALEMARFAAIGQIINKEDEQRKNVLDKSLGDFKSQVPKVATLDGKITANATTEANTRKQIAKDEAENRILLAKEIGNTLSALSDVVGRETAAGKALAIAQATINTFLGITEVWKSKAVLPEPFNTATKIAATVTTAAGGFAAVRNIAKTKVPGAGGGGAPAIPTMQTTAPLTPALSPAVQGQALNAQAINNLGNNAMRAYVLNSDIQNNDQRNAYLQRNARIG